MAILFALGEFFPEICREKVAEEIFFHNFVLLDMSDLGFEPPTLYLLEMVHKT